MIRFTNPIKRDNSMSKTNDRSIWNYSSLNLDVPFNLNSQQKILHESLLEKDELSARIYYGALCVLADFKNPDRAALASHNLRELLTRITIYLGFEINSFRENVNSKLFDLSEKWANAKRNSKCLTTESFKGEIDPTLNKFLLNIDKFFEWMEYLEPRRSQIRRKTLQTLDQSPTPLPQHIEDKNLRKWKNFYGYFSAIAHHPQSIRLDEFESSIHHLESFLINYFHPQTFIDMNEIDEIIKKVEGNDRS